MKKKMRRPMALLVTVLGALALFAVVAAVAAAPGAPPQPDEEALPDTVRFGPVPGIAITAAAPQLPSPAEPIPLPDPAWRIGVATDGLYVLDYATLAAAGVPVTGAAADFHLLWRGEEVALEEVGTGDGAFDPGDALRFYGEKFHGSVQDEKYTDENVYWLAVDDSAPGLRMATRNVAPSGPAEPAPGCTHTLRVEQNNIYWARYSVSPGTATTWFWERINSPTTITGSYTFTLTSPVTQGYTATLAVEVASYNYTTVNPDHHLRLTLNATGIGEFYWDGKIGRVVTTGVPAGVLHAGVNTLQVAYLTDVGHQTVYFDRADLIYRRQPEALAGSLLCVAPLSGTTAYTFTNLAADTHLYDVSAPLHPVALTGYAAAGSEITFHDTAPNGARYLASAPAAVSPVRYDPPADLLAPAEGADELVIAPRSFLDALQPLLAARQGQGLRMRAVAVEDIYPLFNGGIFHPEAIRSFVAYAHAHWPGPPLRYLFLVGDGNFNFKGYNPAIYGEFVPTLIPPYLEFADPEQGEVPVDTRFGDVDGDGMPEVYVGRIPAQTVAEVTGYVAKVLAYESRPAAAWQLHVLLAADDGASTSTGNEGFSLILDRLARDYVPGSVTTETVYIADYCSGPDRPGITPCISATHALTEAWNAGAALLTYAGHGSIHRWGHEKFLLNTQLPEMKETVALPFLIALDCWDSYWMFPPKYPAQDATDVRSIGEWAATVMTESGAVAAFGPAGLGYAYQEEQLARAMYRAAFQKGAFDLGALTQAGRGAISYSYLARTYTLLGDPALSLPWWERLILTPTVDTVTVGSLMDLRVRFEPQGETRFGQTLPVTPTWTADAGALDAYGLYTAPTTAGVVSLAGHLGQVSDVVTLNVIAGPPVSITVTPDPLVIEVNQTAQMTVTPHDAWGNPAVLTTTAVWSASVGAIDASGLFTASSLPAQGWITATVPVSQGTSTVWLSDAARVEVRAFSYIYLPLILRD